MSTQAIEVPLYLGLPYNTYKAEQSAEFGSDLGPPYYTYEAQRSALRKYLYGIDLEDHQNKLMERLFLHIASGEQVNQEYPWQRIRSSLLHQVVMWVYSRHVIYIMFSSEDVAEHIGSYLFFPHEQVVNFLLHKAGVPLCADFCYIREAIVDGTFYEKCICCGSEDVDGDYHKAYCYECECTLRKSYDMCNDDHLNIWKCEDCNWAADADCYICAHRNDSIALFEFHQSVLQNVPRKDMCEKFRLKMKCDYCREQHCCSDCVHEWEGDSAPCRCYCHEK